MTAFAQRCRAESSRSNPSCSTGRRCARATTAFTIVELLVAASITALIAGFIAVLLRNVSTTWTRAGNRLGTDARARIVLDQLQVDLQGAMFRDDGNVWLAADVLNGATGNPGTPWQAAARNPKPAGGLSLQMTAANIADARFGTAGVWLRFFTSSRPVTSVTGATTVPSAPVAVGYQIVRRFIANNPQNLNTGYLLHRTEARPATTGTGSSARPGVLESGYNITAAAYASSTAGTNNGAPGDPRSIQNVSTNPRGNLESVMAENVIDFGVRCYVRDAATPGGLRLIYPATAAGALSNATGSTTALRARLPSHTPTDIEDYNHRTIFPDVVDVMVRILTDEGAALIANIERVQNPALPVPQKYNNNAQQWWWGLAQENSRVYTRRIVLNAESI